MSADSLWARRLLAALAAAIVCAACSSSTGPKIGLRTGTYTMAASSTPGAVPAGTPLPPGAIVITSVRGNTLTGCAIVGGGGGSSSLTGTVTRKGSVTLSGAPFDFVGSWDGAATLSGSVDASGVMYSGLQYTLNGPAGCP